MSELTGQAADLLIHRLNGLLNFPPPGRIARMTSTLTELFGQPRQVRGSGYLFDTDGLRWHVGISVGKVEADAGYSPTTYDGSGWATASVDEIEIVTPREVLVWCGHSRGFIKDWFLPGPWWETITAFVEASPRKIREAGAKFDNALLARRDSARQENARLAADWLSRKQ